MINDKRVKHGTDESIEGCYQSSISTFGGSKTPVIRKAAHGGELVCPEYLSLLHSILCHSTVCKA